jgi:WD40-like Beta Propeller Repeat
MSEDTTQAYGLLHIKRIGDRWLKPQKANLNKKELWEQEAFFSYEGDKIYYAVSVLVSDTVHTKIWVSNKTKNGWAKGELLNSPINESARRVFYATLSKNGNLYYTNVDEVKIHISENNNGKYDNIQEIGLPRAGHAYIAPDEDFIIFDYRRADTYGQTDIYIAFKTSEGSWGEPINLGPQINTEYLETCPSLSPDGKYIFFGRYNDENEKSDIYWISSEIIGKIRKNDI